jgi:hypothetical protein
MNLKGVLEFSNAWRDADYGVAGYCRGALHLERVLGTLQDIIQEKGPNEYELYPVVHLAL